MCRSVQLLPPPRNLLVQISYYLFLKLGDLKILPFFFKFSVALFLYNRIIDINTF